MEEAKANGLLETETKSFYVSVFNLLREREDY